MQGDTPGTGGANDPGFKHVIANEVGKVQRFQQVDAQGNVFGGSFDPAYNKAHAAELAGKTAAQTGLLGQGPTVRTAAARPFDAGNFVGPSAGGFTSVVDGVPNQFATQAEAEQDYNRRTGAAGQQPSQPAAPSQPSQPSSPSQPAAPDSSGSFVNPSTGVLTNPAENALWAQLANNAAMMAYNNARLHEVEIPAMQHLDENAKEQLRQEAAKQAWLQTYQTISTTGKMPDGTPTLEAAKAIGIVAGSPTLEATRLTGEQTGQVPNTGIAARAAAAFAQAKAANPLITGSGPEAAGIWRQTAGITQEQGAAMAARANAYYASTGSAMPDDVAAKALGEITGRPATAFQTLTPAAQQVANDTARVQNDAAHQRNADAINALQVLSTLRGPENAFVYAQTLANMPDSIKQTIQQMTANLPVTSNLNPAQRGVLGDVGALPSGQPTPLGTGPTAIGAPAVTSPAVPGMPAGPVTADPRGAKVGLAGGMTAAATNPLVAGLAAQGGAPAPQPLPPSHAGVAAASSQPVLQRGLIPGAGATTGATPLTLPPADRGPAIGITDPGQGGGGMVHGGPYLTMDPGATPAPMPMPTYTPTPGGGLIDLGSKSTEGYDTVQDPQTGKRYYRGPGGMILDTQTGAQVQDPTVGRDARVGGVGPTGLDPRGPVMSTMPVRFPSTVPMPAAPSMLHTMPVAQRGLSPGAPGTPGAVAAPTPVGPGQLSPTDFQRTNEYGQKMIFAGFENQGMDKGAAMDTYLKSLPVQSASPRVGRRRAA